MHLIFEQKNFDMDYTQFEDFLEKRHNLMSEKIRNHYKLLQLFYSQEWK